MKKINNITKKLLLGATCIAVGFGGFLIGRNTSRVSYVSFYEEGKSASEYKAIRLHKPFAEDDVFVSMNRDDYDKYERKYFPIKENIERSYIDEFAQRRINDVYGLVELEKLLCPEFKNKTEK